MTHDLVAVLRPLLTAEASAEAHASGTEPGDLEQAVWLRLLERLDSDGPPVDPQGWLRRAVRSEVRRTRRTTRRERPYDESAELAGPADDRGHGPEHLALAAARRRALHAAVRRLPGRCPRLLAALLSPKDLTYREIASELGISQGSLGPERSRCLGCLRRLLNAEVAAREPRG
ncbi:sigma-70 family RNA polymerase sigma factor [Streptomyces spongiae]|uniref:Sigma-70 family RNA polymerase sigma factor n=1 Tax=Streptomyces spongiae TaxID=565072 RepID=A0A5N8XP36_9ACTN|nr:sigma-70 family RNA polymerase sigma factor [Streptomyces spongiae]MPY61121.1 sigma-70 family RNA polymerase sigma factor [Streptomyces spongiae]